MSSKRSFALLLVAGLSILGTAACSSGSSTSPSPSPSTSPAAPTSAPVACTATVATTLPGITAHVKNERCDFTLAQAAAGIELAYEIVIANDLPPLFPTAYVTGERALPLLLFGTIEGQGQKYCICDTGPGVAQMSELNVTAGTYPTSYAWDGRNWQGPSDTPSPKGAAFPPGTYTLKLHGEGSHTKPAQGMPFTVDYNVDVTIPITLVP